LENKKIYFASDQHFGAPTKELSKPREALFLQWLQHIEKDCETLFLLGDLFDFWFEYQTVVPKGYVRILGQLARMRDNGITIHFFVGNHDLWMHDYFTEELQIPVYHQPKIFELQGKKLLIGHGDGLGPGDNGYKRMKKVFVHPFSKWLYRWLHPDIGVKFAQYLSVKNKLISGEEDVKFLGKENEWLYLYAQRKYTQNPCDYFVFGHRHLPLEIPLNEQAIYFNLGDWVHYFTYGVMENGMFKLEKWLK